MKKKISVPSQSSHPLTPPIPPVFLSVDPGAKSGWALWVNGELHSWGSLKRADVPSIHELYESRIPTPVATLVIEDQFVCINWKTAKTLIESRMRWQALAEQKGFDVELVNPRTWQSALLKGMPGDTKENSVTLAGALVKKYQKISPEFKMHDVADAICIGEYFTRR